MVEENSKFRIERQEKGFLVLLKQRKPYQAIKLPFEDWLELFAMFSRVADAGRETPTGTSPSPATKSAPKKRA